MGMQIDAGNQTLLSDCFSRIYHSYSITQERDMNVISNKCSDRNDGSVLPPGHFRKIVNQPTNQPTDRHKNSYYKGISILLSNKNPAHDYWAYSLLLMNMWSQSLMKHGQSFVNPYSRNCTVCHKLSPKDLHMLRVWRTKGKLRKCVREGLLERDEVDWGDAPHLNLNY